MDIATVGYAYSGLKTAKDIISGLASLKIETTSIDQINEAVKKVGEAQDTLFQLREELFRLQEENNSLKREISEYRDWNDTISKYILTKTNGGAVVYKYSEEPLHYACPNCIVKKEIQILQECGGYSGESKCPNPNCKSLYQIELDQEPPPIGYEGGASW